MKDDHNLILHLILYLIYREKTVYIKTHKTTINRAVDYDTGWRSKLPAWKGVRIWAGMLFDSIAGLCFHKRGHFLSLYNQCVYIHSPCPTLHVNNWQNKWLHHLMETSRKAVELSWDRQITSIYQTPKIQDLKYRSKHVRCEDEKISKTENKVKVANCDVENLDHQNWQLLEGKSYITSISIIKQKLSLKNWTGSGFGRKIGWDGGSKKKKRRESGI